MELLDRYLQAIKKHLPQKRQDDILAELRANMESQLEDKEEQLGRPLTQGEAEDWLRSMGSPILVASRYRPQQYLIGPTLFPIYLYVVRVALLWAAGIYASVNLILIAFSAPGASSAAEALLRAPGVLITVAGWVTIVFVAFEYLATHHPEKCPPIPGLVGAWSPSSLPPLEEPTPSGRKPRSYAHALAEVIFSFLVLVWLLLIPGNPFLLMGPGVVLLKSGPFQLAPAWWTFYWWIVALNAVQLAWRIVDLLRSAWQYPLEIQHVVFKIFGLVPVGLMLAVRDRTYVLLRNPEVNQAHYGTVLDSINKSVYWGLIAVGIIASAQLIVDIAKMVLRAHRQRDAAH